MVFIGCCWQLLAWLVPCGWLGCPYLGATLSVLSRFILWRSRTSAAIADRSAEAPASSGHRRTTTTLAGRSAEAPASECSGRGRLLRRRVFGKLRFLLCFCDSGSVFSPSRIRRPEKSGERASEPFLVGKIAFLLFQEVCGPMLVHPRKQRCTPVRPETGFPMNSFQQQE